MTDTIDASILVTHLDDPRGLRAIRSLEAGSVWPEEVVLADGGSDADLLQRYEALEDELAFPVRIVHAPGSVAASREGAWRECKGELVVFLDTDEVATERWLQRLTRPMVDEAADFAAGPTEPLEVQDRWDRYHADLDAWFYGNFVAEDIVYAPMGNTAWHARVFEALDADDGYAFDTSLGRGGEDFDVNIRALKAGFEGAYVPDAVLKHDYSQVKGYRTVLKKKFNYARAETRVRQRHSAFLDRRPDVDPTEAKPWHPINLLEPFVRRWAYLKGYLDED